MARINFEDDVESQDEFWALLPLVGGERDTALGKLVRFFRLAQYAFGHNAPMTETDLRARGFGVMIDSGWAVSVPGGYQALGAAKHFGWYRQKVEAGKKGGRPKETESVPPLTEDNRTVPPANPLAPAPAPALDPALEKKRDRDPARASHGVRDGEGEDVPTVRGDPRPNAPSGSSLGEPIDPKFIPTPENFATVRDEWIETLRHYKSGRSLVPGEDTVLVRAIQRYGVPAVLCALEGYRKQVKSDRWDPGKWVDLSHILNVTNFTRYVTAGAKARQVG